MKFNSRTSIKGRYEGRLGLILNDVVNRRVLAITAAQVGGTSDVSSNGKVIGKVIDNPILDTEVLNTEGTLVPAENQLSVIELDNELAFSTTQINFPYGEMIEGWKIIEEDASYLGEDVLVHNQDPAPQAGKYISSNALLRTPSAHTKKIVTFHDLIQVKGKNNEQLMKKGDSGSLLTTSGGHPLGINIASADGYSFFAKPHLIIRALGMDSNDSDILNLQSRFYT